MFISSSFSKRMDKLIQKAGGMCNLAFLLYEKNNVLFFLLIDFELQVTTLECLFRLTTIAERATLAEQWFKGVPSILHAFKSIRESFFEVVCGHKLEQGIEANSLFFYNHRIAGNF